MPSEKKLIQDIISGNKEAFHELYRSDFRKLYLFAKRYVYDHEVAQDLVQDVFFSLWDNSAHIDPNKDIHKYLYSSVKNASLNYLRGVKIKDSHADKIIEALLFSQCEEFEDDPTIKQRLKEVLEQVPEQSRKVLMLHYYQQQRVADISEELSISQNTVKTHLKRALRILRDNLIYILFGISVLGVGLGTYGDTCVAGNAPMENRLTSAPPISRKRLP